MKIVNITNKADWDGAVLMQGGSFLQSWAWGEFQYQYGRSVERLAITAENQILATLQLIKYPLPALRNYYFSPRAPLFEDLEYYYLFLEKIREKAPHNKIIFWRLEPKNEFAEWLKVKDVHPRRTLILKLNQSPDELLKQMKPKTRYNIRLAARKGVRVKVSSKIKDIDILYNLIQQTSQRQEIKSFPRDYYQLMFANLLEENQARLYLAQYKNKIIAANLMVAFGNTMTYLHGGSDHYYRQVMAPYLLQWQAIVDAQQAGIKYYDFFGIDKQKWPGLTRFKQGFGGELKIYPGTFELPLNNIWYKGYKITKKLKS